MYWLHEFAVTAEKTDRLAGKPDHTALLGAGLFGEAGSIVAELKKEHRERQAYPVYRHRMLEEIGDFLWYFVRLATVVAPGLTDELMGDEDIGNLTSGRSRLTAFLDFGSSVGDVLASIGTSGNDEVKPRLLHVWALLKEISKDSGISLCEAADRNTAKTRSRWPDERSYAPLFDDDWHVEEQLPRQLHIEFLERSRGTQKAVILRCNDINFGDRLTDNIKDPDGYRYHDIFHFAYAVHLGWSPVVRALMRSKRKSRPEIDEAQDGARAGVIEEAVSAIVFSRAKQLKFFKGLDHVDFDLLKTVEEFVEGFEVAMVPLWQWEAAILDGYRVFRSLRDGGGGHVTLNLIERQLVYTPPVANNDRT
ncbi:MAG: pyrophosphatase [Bacteroidetes bacterium]|nr:pyrophosphatase [Bacteroidota bacterium]